MDLTDFATRIELTYRAFAREHRAVEDQFEDVLSKFVDIDQMVVGGNPIIVSDCGTMHMPISVSDTETAKRQGFLVIENGNCYNRIVRQWELQISVPSPAEALVWIDEILKVTGPVFTNIKIVQDFFTDIPPQ